MTRAVVGYSETLTEEPKKKACVRIANMPPDIWTIDFKNMNLDWDPAVGHESHRDHLLVFGAKNLKAYKPEGPGSHRAINYYNAYEKMDFLKSLERRDGEPRVELETAQNKSSSWPWRYSNSDPSVLGTTALPKLQFRVLKVTMHHYCGVASTLSRVSDDQNNTDWARCSSTIAFLRFNSWKPLRNEINKYIPAP